MLTLTARMTWIATQLRNAIGVFAARQARAHQVTWLGSRAYAPRTAPDQPAKLPDATWLLLFNRLGRLSTRFQALHDRWRSNTLPARRAPTPRQRAGATQSHEELHNPAPPRLPQAQAWVSRRIPEAAPSVGQFEALLHDPQTRALTEAAPQAGRLLRPLCRALGIPQPGWLKLPRRARTPHLLAPLPAGDLAPSAVEPPPAPAPVSAPDRPLQSYVRAAARAWKRKSA
jgi:hypothetical protein